MAVFTIEEKRKRSKVLEWSIIYEALTTAYLSGLLDIDYRDSIAFGNGGSSLSFSYKVNLLMDLKIIPKAEKELFFKFMSIRNQFMHNIKASSFQKCYQEIDGLEKYLLKKYPQKKEFSVEKKYEKCFDELCNELGSSLSKMHEALKNKFREKAKNEVTVELNNILVERLHKKEPKSK